MIAIVGANPSMLPKPSFFDRLRTASWRRLGRFARDDRGVTMVEFAVLAVPFFVIIGAIMETAIVFLASQLLSAAVDQSSRLIRTGQAQQQNYTLDDFRQSVCDGLVGLFNCNNLEIRVSTVTDFASATVNTTPLDPTDPSKWQLVQDFEPGTGNQVVIVQVYYKWPVVMNFAGFNLESSPDGTRLLGAVQVFANEPFTAGSST